MHSPGIDERAGDAQHRPRLMRVQLAILADAGFTLPKAATILDLGCGNGDLVAAYRTLGYQAYGCDFAFKPGHQVDALSRQGYIRLIEQPYRMPFDDGFFDVVVSNEVFEHVRNYRETLAEHSRVLKPDGVGLHFIPSRFAPVELHVYVPLATIIQDYWWLRLWSALGVRIAAQKGQSARERARWNEHYLKNHTNYLTKRQLQDEFLRQFESVTFNEGLFLKHSRRARFLHTLSAVLPGLPAVYRTLRSRVVICSRRKAHAASELAAAPPLAGSASSSW